MKFFPDALEKVQSDVLTDIDVSMLSIPEKILQFGSGFLFRKLPYYNMDKGNNKQVFSGKVVAIKSTSNFLPDTLNPKNVTFSRVLSEKEQWPEIMSCADNPDLAFIISGKKIVKKNLLKDNIYSNPPFSFPGKLLAIMFKRFQCFAGASHRGLIIICPDGKENNAELLESIVLELAHLNNLEPAFLDWIETGNHFCNKVMNNPILTLRRYF